MVCSIFVIFIKSLNFRRGLPWRKMTYFSQVDYSNMSLLEIVLLYQKIFWELSTLFLKEHIVIHVAYIYVIRVFIPLCDFTERPPGEMGALFVN